MTSTCIFCRIVGGDLPGDVVYQDDQVVAFRDIQPKAPTHVLVVPREHIASARELTPDHGRMLGAMLAAASRVAEAEGVAQTGYRLVINTGPAAGQAVDHVHLHVLGGRRLGSMG